MAKEAGRARLDAQPKGSKHHDVLLIAPEGVHGEGEFYRFPVTKQPEAGEHEGEYSDRPELWRREDSGQRKVDSVARPQEYADPATQGIKRGPAFAAVPQRPEPAATSCAACYVVNAQNLAYENLWTDQPLNTAPSSGSELALRHPDEVDVLIAASHGRVFRLQLHGLDSVGMSESGAPIEIRGEDGAHVGTLEEIRLNQEMEIWSQLRNGCVAGRSLLAKEHKVVPLVNVTALMDLEAEESPRAASPQD